MFQRFYTSNVFFFPQVFLNIAIGTSPYLQVCFIYLEVWIILITQFLVLAPQTRSNYFDVMQLFRFLLICLSSLHYSDALHGREFIHFVMPVLFCFYNMVTKVIELTSFPITFANNFPLLRAKSSCFLLTIFGKVSDSKFLIYNNFAASFSYFSQ